MASRAQERMRRLSVTKIYGFKRQFKFQKEIKTAIHTTGFPQRAHEQKLYNTVSPDIISPRTHAQVHVTICEYHYDHRTSEVP